MLSIIPPHWLSGRETRLSYPSHRPTHHIFKEAHILFDCFFTRVPLHSQTMCSLTHSFEPFWIRPGIYYRLCKPFRFVGRRDHPADILLTRNKRYLGVLGSEGEDWFARSHNVVHSAWNAGASHARQQRNDGNIAGIEKYYLFVSRPLIYYCDILKAPDFDLSLQPGFLAPDPTNKKCTLPSALKAVAASRIDSMAWARPMLPTQDTTNLS